MARKIATLQQPYTVIQKLLSAGYVECCQLVSAVLPDTHRSLLSPPSPPSVTHCARLLTGLVPDLQLEEAVGVVRELLATPTVMSANQLPPAQHVTTFSRQLDRLLDGGFAVGALTELVATPGGGKTQLCLQACVSACLPSEAGALDGCAVYIDTEGGFSAVRLAQIASAAVDHCRSVMSRHAAASLTTERVVARVRVLQCHSVDELLLLPLALSQLLREQAGREGAGGGDNSSQCRPLVRLIAVDSVAAPLRGHCSQYAERSLHLQWLAAELSRLARHYAAAVIITNHMTTALGDGGASSQLTAALGARWQHCCPVRVRLDWLTRQGQVDWHGYCGGTGGGGWRSEREAVLLKHWRAAACLTARFQLLAAGVRDTVGAEWPACVNSGDDGGGDMGPLRSVKLGVDPG